MTAVALRAAVQRTGRALFTFAVFQAAWFACVMLAADGAAGWGMAAVGAAVALHLARSDRLRADAWLLAGAMGIGLAWDTLALQAGWVDYAAPGPVPGLAPAWILAMWALFATVLREPLRWLHGRPWLAALLGGVGGPFSYAAAAGLGACRFDDPAVSLAALAAGWALITPLLVALAHRLDAAPPEHRP